MKDKNNMKTICLIITILSLLLITRPAEADILNIIPDARSSAMGEISSTLEEDVFSLHHNPAALAGIGHTELAYTNDNVLDNRDYWFAGIAYSLRDVRSTTLRNLGTLAGSYSELSSDSEYMLITAAYGRPFYLKRDIEEVFGGVAVKYKTEDHDDGTSERILVDTGLLWRFPFKNVSLGLTARNIGRSRDDEPLTFTLGTSLRTLKESLFIGLDYRQTDQGQSGAGIGSEYRVLDALRLRTGFSMMRGRSSGMAGGIGIVLRDVDVMFTFIREINLDYAYVPYIGDEGAHRLGIVFKLGAD